MNSQKQILAKFRQIVGNKTLDQCAKITGIERTRFFRLQQGAEMRISEYEKVLRIIHQFEENWSPTRIKAKDFDESGGEMGRELWERIDRVMRYRELLGTSLLNV